MIWYQKPAKDFTEAIPFGNGSFGGMIYGGVETEKISLNSDTLWSGTGIKQENCVERKHLEHVRELVEAEKCSEAGAYIKENMLGFFYESYMPMGSLLIKQLGGEEVKNYARRLDMNVGIVSSEFTRDEIVYRKELFSSYVDGLIMMRYSASENGALHLEFGFDSELKHVCMAEERRLVIQGECPSHVEPTYVNSENPIQYDSENKGIQFVTVASVVDTDGQCSMREGKVILESASYCVIAIVTENGFKKYNLPLNTDVEAMRGHCIDKLSTIEAYSVMKENHRKDYQKLFDRMDMSLGGSNLEHLPTDERLQRLRDGGSDNGLYALYFQFGRYLMISSSREGSQAINLQGIWNEDIRPAWCSNYTTNINTQMNYWPVNSANLSECEEPLITMLEELSEQGRWAARNQFHCRGWVTNHNVDLWRQAAPVGGNAHYAYWPMGGVWLATHAYMHYEYTQDQQYLSEKGYAIMKGAVEFCLDWLYEDQDGRLQTCPSTSPENTFYDPNDVGKVAGVGKSCASDIAIMKHLLDSFVKASELLGKDVEMRKRVEAVSSCLPQYKVGKDGCLQEWNQDYEEVDKGHRHFSPLYGVYPGNSIREEHQEIMKAAHNLIRKRLANGGGHTGWSCAWLIALFARLKDREGAAYYLNQLLTKSTYDNLFDLHPPLGNGKEVFQIDGNFGGVAGIIEMLAQNQNGEIEFLPCIPEGWSEGSVRGLKLRGGIEVSFSWKDHRVREQTIEVKMENK